MKRKVVSGIVLTLLLLSVLSSAFIAQPVKAEPGTIYIRADGSVDPPTAPVQRDGNMYTFTDNVYDSIVVQRNNVIIDGAGYRVQGTGAIYSIGIDLTERTNVTVREMEVKAFYYGIFLNQSLNNKIAEINLANNAAAIWLHQSLQNDICDNSVFNEGFGVFGINLDSSSYNRIYRNNITRIIEVGGITLWTCSYNDIFGNTITNGNGIWLSDSTHNTIIGNAVNSTASEWYEPYNVIVGSSNNVIYHNNFIMNRGQLRIENSVNLWDDGYPSGGNYWSNYTGVDLKSGPNQDQLGSDGIGDTPFVLDENNRDQYPLMNPWIPTPPTPDFSITASPTSLTIQQGSSGTSVITITSMGGFNEPVTLTVSGAPSGVIWGFSSRVITPPPDGSITSTLTVSVGATATAGSYTLPVKGTNDTLTHSVNISLKITALPPTENQPPIADAGLDQSVSSGDLVVFNGSKSDDPDGTIISYRWNFGDGNTAEDKIVMLRFRGAQNGPKTYTITLTVEDNNGATDIDTVEIIVTPLQKPVRIFTRPYVPIGEMTVTYNWVDEIDGENIYIVSKIRVVTKGFTGVCKPRIFDQQGQIMWSDYLLIGPGKPYVKDYVSPFAVSRLGKSATITTLTFLDGSFEGIRVRGSDSMGISMSGIDIISALIEGVKRATDWLLEILQPYLDVDDILKLAGAETWDYPVAFSKSSSTQFNPGSTEVLGQPREAPDLYLAYLRSPGELRVYDSQGLVTGLVNGEVKEDIPNSTYINNTVMMLFPSDSYRYVVVGTEDGSYGLIAASITQGDSHTFTATNLPISTNAIHQYFVNWTALSQGEKGVTVQIDSNGDRTFEKTFTADSELTRDAFMLQVPLGEAFPMWIVGVAIAMVAVITVAVAVFWRRRKQPPTKR